MSRFRAFVALGVAVGLGALAQESPPPSLFGEIVDVRLVNIEVVVTDNKEQRVSGLSAEDFRLLVDGKEVEISNFSEIREGQVVSPAAGEAGGAEPIPLAEKAVPTHYLVFIDDFFSFAIHRNRVLTRLGEQLSMLGENDRMALVAFNGKKLELVTNWSRSLSQLDAGLTAASKRPSFGGMHRAQRGQVVDDPGAGEQLELPLWVPRDEKLNVFQRGFAMHLEMLLTNEINAARAAMRAMGGVEGRKVLLLLSGGWPFSPQEYAANFQTTFPEQGLKQGEQLYQPLVDAANLLGYTVYPVDLPGLGGSGEPRVGPGSPSAPSLISESNLEASLSFFAKQTGGRTFLNTARDKAFETAVADTRTYYWLGFSPDRRRDDKQHEIKVKMGRRGLDVRFRKSFHDLSRGTELSMMVESSLLFGEAPSKLPLPVKVGEIKPLRGGKMEVPFLVGIPVDQVTILEIGGEYVAELELRIGVLDAHANMSEVSTLPIRLASKQQPQRGKLVRYDTSIKVWKEAHEVVLSLFDPATGRLLSTRLSVAP